MLIRTRCLTLLFILISGFLLGSCGSDESASSGGGGSSNMSIVMKSSQISTSSFLAKPTKIKSSDGIKASATSCSVTVETTPVSGTCYSPTEVSGSFNQARLESASQGVI